jgi:hypothetical protein
MKGRAICNGAPPCDRSGRHAGPQEQTPGVQRRASASLDHSYFDSILKERATGLEPATSSLGSWHSTN